MYQGLQAFCNNVTKISETNTIYIIKNFFAKKIFIHTYEVKKYVTFVTYLKSYIYQGLRV